MVVLHYAGITKTKFSGVSVIVPKIINAQTNFAQVGLYNYGSEHFEISDSAVDIKAICSNDDYHSFPEPFSKPDVVVFHSPFGIPRCAVIAKMLKKDKIPYVVVPHGCFSDFAMKKKSLKKNIARFVFMDRFVKNAAKMQYLSEGEKNASVYNTESIVVPNGIDLPSLFEKDKENNVLEVSFIGRKDLYHKGLDFLIDACGIAKNNLSGRIVVNIYGPGTDEQNATIEQLIEKNGVGDFVFSKPAVVDDEKFAIYRNTDIFVLTSRFEGQPVAILEAWAHGVPTLVTEGTNVSEECAENKCGWVVGATPTDIADKLTVLVNEREQIREYAKNARAYTEKTYNWCNVADLYQESFVSIIGCDNI